MDSCWHHFVLSNTVLPISTHGLTTQEVCHAFKMMQLSCNYTLSTSQAFKLTNVMLKEQFQNDEESISKWKSGTYIQTMLM